MGISSKIMLRYIKNHFFMLFAENRSSPKDDTPVNCLKIKVFHILYANKLTTHTKSNLIVELICTEMLENGMRLAWNPEDSENEDEKEVFHFKESHIERVFKVCASCTIIPFL
jgi:hypothetical protein